jgi:DNA-binding XRE family transcriptional regulator
VSGGLGLVVMHVPSQPIRCDEWIWILARAGWPVAAQLLVGRYDFTAGSSCRLVLDAVARLALRARGLPRVACSLGGWVVERSVMSDDRLLVVGREVRRLRLAAGLSGVELARRAGVPQPTVSRVETGRRVSDAEVVVALFSVLGLEPGGVGAVGVADA